MRKPIFFGLLALATLAPVAPAWSADSVTRKSAKGAISGDITANTATELTIKPKSGDAVAIPANDIASVSWNGEPATLRLARGDEDGGRLTRALDTYTKAAGTLNSPGPGLKADVEFAIARTTAKIALADATKLDEAISKLEAFRSKNADNYNHFEGQRLLGQLYMAKKDPNKARVAFETLGKAPWKDYQMASKNFTARMLLVESKSDEAAAAFDSVIGMKADNPAEESQRQEAMLGKARILTSQNKLGDAVNLLNDVINKASPEDARVQAEAYVRQGDCLQAQGKDKDAILAYLHVDVLFASEKSLHAESLFHLTRLWSKLGQAGRAAETREKLENEYPNSEWARQLKGAPAEAAG